MASNPNPTRISAAMWRFWEEFHALEPGAKLGGIYAAKAGYHRDRSSVSSSDYSSGGQVAADRNGPSDKASAIDITMGEADMIRYTKRLDAAARARDKRLYPPGKPPVLREFIGTKDGSTVYCYVLTGGHHLGVGADAGPDPGRDPSHLWHIHGSFIRQYANDWDALEGVLSVLRGETYEEWENGMALDDTVYTNEAGGRRTVRAILQALDTRTDTIPADVWNHPISSGGLGVENWAAREYLKQAVLAARGTDAIAAAVAGVLAEVSDDPAIAVSITDADRDTIAARVADAIVVPTADENAQAVIDKIAD